MSPGDDPGDSEAGQKASRRRAPGTRSGSAPHRGPVSAWCHPGAQALTASPAGPAQVVNLSRTRYLGLGDSKKPRPNPTETGDSALEVRARPRPPLPPRLPGADNAQLTLPGTGLGFSDRFCSLPSDTWIPYLILLHIVRSSPSYFPEPHNLFEASLKYLVLGTH